MKILAAVPPSEDWVLFQDETARAELTSHLNSPFCIKTRAIIEGFLRSDASSRKSSIKIGTPHCLSFRCSFREEHGEAPNECVARASAVDTSNRKRRQVLAYPAARQKASVGTQSNDDAANAARQQFIRAS
jgi:hypothetical protein